MRGMVGWRAAVAWVLWSPGVALAGWDHPPMSLAPQELLAEAARSSVALDPNDAFPDDVHIVLEELVHTVEEDGTYVETWRLVFAPLTRGAVDDWGTLSVQYDPWREDRPAISARVVAADGQVAALDPSTIADSAASADPSVLSDARWVSAPLPRLAVGSVVEEVAVRRVRPLLDGQYQSLLVLERDRPIEHVRVVLDAPSALPMDVRLVGQDDVIQRRKRKGRVVHELELDGVRPLPLLPAGTDPAVPEYLLFEATSVGSWPEVGAAYGARVADALAGPVPAELLVAADGLQGVAAVAALATAIHERVRYTGVELGEAAIVPYSPQTVLDRGYGDCKDKANLLVAALRAIGQDAQLVLARAGADAARGIGSPGLARFDHAVARVAGPQELWIDVTDPHTPVTAIPIGLQGREVLVVDGAASRVVKVPLDAASRNTVRDEVRLTVHGNGRVGRDHTNEVGGEASGRVRRAALGSEDVEAWARDGFGDAALAEGAVLELDLGGLDGAPAVFRLVVADDPTLSVESQALAIVPMSQLVGMFLPTFGLPSSIASEGDRSLSDAAGVELVFAPGAYHLEAMIALPDELALAGDPVHLFTEVGDAVVRYDVEPVPGGVAVRVDLDPGGGRMSVDAARSLREATLTLLEELERPIRLGHRAWMLAGRGDLAGAVALERAARAREPEVAMHAVDLAGLLMELGQTDAAARELSAAAALDPDLPALWLTRARLLSSDAHGRTLGVELDREALLASARRALELAPADPAAHEAVAWALLRSSTGRPLGVGSEPEAAALHMRSLILDDHYELGDLYIRTELVAGDRARLEATLDGLQGASVDAARVTLRALRDGPEAAVRMLDQDVSADEVGAVAGVIAQHLTACGEFTLAADLVTELARVRGTPPPDPRWIGFMRAVGEAELAAPAPDSAEWLAYTLMNGMAVGASPAREHLTRAARRDPAVMALVRSTSAPALNLDATPALTERLVAVATADVAGDDRIGHRVVWKTGLSDGSVNRITFYTVKERGEHRLLGISPAVDPVVEHALGLAERGEMDGARQVLRWLADEGSRLGARVRAGLAAAGESDDDLMWAVWMAAASVDPSSTAVDRLAEGLPGIDRPALAIAVAGALDDALRRRGDLTGALLAASGLRERFAEHEEAQHLWGIAAARVGDPSFEAWLAQQRASAGDEVVYALMEASWRSARGDVAGVLELLRARVESSGARLELMNHLVWAEVMAGEPSAHDVGVLGAFVQRAVDAGGSPLAYAGALHTLATAQVELGLHREALAGMRQAIAGGVLDPDELGEWGLVAGGLAAAAGDDARARALWQTAAGDPEAEVRALAQRFAAELSP